MSSLLQRLKEVFDTDTLEVIGRDGGCISDGISYKTANGKKIFVKSTSKPQAYKMFVGEEKSLEAILTTGTVKAPKPIQVIADLPDGSCSLVMEYLDLGYLKDEGQLGNALAKLHKDNWRLMENPEADREAILKFGFFQPTYCGSLEQRNTWRDDWATFFSEKIDHQIDILKTQDGKAKQLWELLRPRLFEFFRGLDIKPSLLHGDLWSGNAGQTAEGVVIYDPASFYGHHEYDLGIASMFGGFGRQFYDSYFKELPKEPGFEQRQELYRLFHYLNHWNLFGAGYRSSAINIMEKLIKAQNPI